MKLTILLLIALATPAVTPALAASVVSAGERELLRGVPDRWGFTLGGFWQTFDTKVRFDGETSRGTDIDFETDLGLDRKLTGPGISGFYRFSNRHRLDLAYVPWGRECTQTIDRQIEWGDVVYDAGATITSKAKVQLFNAIYRYSFFNNGRVTFGLNAGISSLWSDFSLSGEGTISGGTDVSGTITERKSVIFPIPVIGLHLELMLVKKLFWRLEDNFFAASISGYAGKVNEFNTSFVWFPVKHFGVGGGFSSTLYTVKTSGTQGADVRIRYGFSGVTAYLQFPF